jgi:ABC-type hemin transport system ATPase subunit
MEDPDYRREGELLGFGLGAIAGACLQAAFLKQHNDSVENGKIEFLILDEPTATVDLWKKPGFYQGFTQGEHAVPGVIMVEHGLQCEGFFAGRTVMQRNGDQTPSELIENDQKHDS